MSILPQTSRWKKCAPVIGFVAYTGLLALGAAGCKQTEGERCEIDTDCSSGLRCEVTAGNGICRQPGFTSNTGADAAGTVDTSPGTSDVSSSADGRTDAAADGAPDASRDTTGDVTNPADVAPDLRGDGGGVDATTDVSDATTDQAG